MATAKRVVQALTELPRYRKVKVQNVLTVERDGKPGPRSVGPITYEAVIDGYDYQTNPDRIMLDLSLEEAKVIRTSLFYSPNSKAQGILAALTLLPSPEKATDTSAKEGGSLLQTPGPADARAARANEANTASSAMDALKAQQAALANARYLRGTAQILKSWDLR